MNSIGYLWTSPILPGNQFIRRLHSRYLLFIYRRDIWASPVYQFVLWAQRLYRHLFLLVKDYNLRDSETPGVDELIRRYVAVLFLELVIIGMVRYNKLAASCSIVV